MAFPSTNFIPRVTVITSEWLQAVNDRLQPAANVTDIVLKPDLAAPTGSALVGGGNQVVASIAALRTLLKTSASKDAFVTGYYTSGDGGGGAYWYDSTDTTSADNGGTIVVATDGGRWKLAQRGYISVAQFGAVGGPGTVDYTLNIQAAVDWAKAQTTNGQPTQWRVDFPDQFYMVTAPINCTNAYGLLLQGVSSAKGQTTVLLGQTGSAILDFSGATLSGFDGLTLWSMYGWANRSTIGALFLRSTTGGIGNFARNFNIEMNDDQTGLFNGGIGTIGIVNCQAEEFTLGTCQIHANCSMISSSRTDIAPLGYTHNFASDSLITASIQQGPTSMGVTTCVGTCSFVAYEQRAPVIMLHQANSWHFEGYLGRINAGVGIGTVLEAVRSYSSVNVNIKATNETNSTIVNFLAYMEDNWNVRIVEGIVLQPTNPLFMLSTIGKVINSNLSVVTSNVNRAFATTPLVNGGNDPVVSFIKNSTLTCTNIANDTFIDRGLLKQSSNIICNSTQPFRKKGNMVELIGGALSVSMGTIATPTTALLARFRMADRATASSWNAGSYRVIIDGSIMLGTYATGEQAINTIHSEITICQGATGVRSTQSPVTTQNKSNLSTASADFTAVNASISFGTTIAGYGDIKLLVAGTSGTVGSTPITFLGSVAVETNQFYVNASVIV